MLTLAQINIPIQPTELRKNLSRYLHVAQKEPVIIGTARGETQRINV